MKLSRPLASVTGLCAVALVAGHATFALAAP